MASTLTFGGGHTTEMLNVRGFDIFLKKLVLMPVSPTHSFMLHHFYDSPVTFSILRVASVSPVGSLFRSGEAEHFLPQNESV